MPERRLRGVKLLILLALLLLAPCAKAQLKLNDFMFTVPFEQSNATVRASRPKSLLLAGEAQVLSNDLYGAKIVRIENYQLDGKTNVIIRAPECVFNADDTTAWSTNRLELDSPSGLHIDGIGFIAYLTNFNVIISNNVRTLVQQRLLQSAPDVTGGRVQTNQLAATNIAMTVTADRFELNYASNIIIYTGHVQVDHSQLTLESARLTAWRNTNGILEHVVAEQEVRIVNKVDHSQASGDLAVYTLAPVETIELTGHAQWNDDQRRSRADVFVFQPKQRHLRAQGHAWMSLPRQSVAQPEFGPAKAPKVSPQAPVEITADLLDFQMPTTNQPFRSLSADRNVVIVSAADQGRATADKAVFDDRTGLAELTGHATWQAGDRVARGQLLRYDRTNHIFFAQRDAYLKLPVSEFGSSTNKPAVASGPKKSARSTNAPPQFVEVYSSDYTYTSNSLVFHEKVRGHLLEGDAARGSIQCSLLGLRFTNQLESAIASGGVKIEQFPWLSPSGRKVAKTMRCEQLNVRMQPSGNIERIIAETNVFAEQHEWRGTNTQPVRSLFTADNVVADFFPRTNTVKEAEANGHVSLLQQGRIANGERALYHGATDLLELAGHPTAEFPEARITDAEVLIWDRKQNKLFGSKLKGQGEPHLTRTNQVIFTEPLRRK